MPPVVTNNREENQAVFSRHPVRTGLSTYNETIKSINSHTAIIIMESLAEGIRGSKLKRNIYGRNLKLVAFPRATCNILSVTALHRHSFGT